MKFDLASIKDAVKNALKELGFSKPEDEGRLNTATEAITNALGAQLKPFENFEETVNNAVAAAMGNATKDMATSASVTEIVTNSVKDFVKKEDLTSLENSIAQKLGNSAHEQEDTKEVKIKNKKDLYRQGTFEKN